MVFDAAGQIRRKVIWYFCAPGALPLPFPHRFGSTNWQPIPRCNSEIGEQWDSSFKWRNGSRPAQLTGQGSFCGDPSWWQDGCPSDAPDLQLNPQGIALCCLGGRPGHGGALAGGSSVVRVPCQPPLPPFELQTPDFAFRPPDHSETAPDYQWIWFTSGGCFAVFHFYAPMLPCAQAWVVVAPPPQGIRYSMTLISYDRSSGVGTWVVDQTAPCIAGQTFYVREAHRFIAGQGGAAAGGSSPNNPIFKSGQGGALAAGSAIVSQREAPVAGGSSAGGSSELLVGLAVAGGSSAGGSSELLVDLAVAGGSSAGGSSELVTVLAAAGGSSAGGTIAESIGISGQGGAVAGGTSATTWSYDLAGGAKAGAAAAALRERYNLAGGAKAGGTSALRSKFALHGGGKAGGTSSVRKGIASACCSVAIPLVLNVKKAGVFSDTATGTVGGNSWVYTDPDTLVTYTLSCSGGVWALAHSSVTHCSFSISRTSSSCGPPFDALFSVSISGALCGIADSFSLEFYPS
jgi:hypothetical protein